MTPEGWECVAKSFSSRVASKAEWAQLADDYATNPITADEIIDTIRLECLDCDFSVGGFTPWALARKHVEQTNHEIKGIPE